MAADQYGKGSLLYKVVIFLLTVALVTAIWVKAVEHKASAITIIVIAMRNDVEFFDSCFIIASFQNGPRFIKSPIF